MASYNKVLLMGNLTRDPELRMTPKGTAVTQLGLAVNRRYRDDQGNDKEEVTFVDVEAWGKQAEVIAKYFTKGKPIFLEGRLRLDSWEDKNTKEKKSKLKVILESFQFMSDGRGAGGAPAAGGESQEPSYERSAPPPRPGAQRSAPAPRPDKDLEEDVPF